MGDFVPPNLGWHPDLPDFRDFSPHSPEVSALFTGLELSTAEDQDSVDLRDFFPPVRQQADPLSVTDSCAVACVSLLQYFQQRSIGRSRELSSLFLAYNARRIGASVGLLGLDLRSHLSAVVTFGLPPEQVWPSVDENVDQAPDAASYAFAEAYRSVRYVRLDGRNVEGTETLKTVKSFLAAGFPCVFGFAVPSSLSSESDIPFHPRFSFVRGGEALVAVGYDDDRRRGTRGALLVRASWGEAWGESGYGWVPYAFVEEQLASCFWTILSREWLESGEFKLPLPIEHELASHSA